MKYFYPYYQNLHSPSIDLSDGLPGYKHLEVSSRVELILEGLLQAYETDVVRVKTLANEAVIALHERAYIEFLLAIVEEIEEGEEYIPPLFRSDLSKSPLYFQGGMYCNEIGTPIGKRSIQAALNSAQTAIEAAKYMLQKEDSVFALTRPPGHHAGRARYGGYCFFNNAYLAVDVFLQADKKVVVVDIDYHIGDGSLEFASANAPYYSLHANTSRNYPYLDAGFTNENEYVHLQEFQTGISGEEYLKEVEKLLEKVVQEQSDALVLSLGFDTLGTDYTQDEYIYVKAEDFRQIGKLFGCVKVETLILLEGGYDSEFLALCAKNFMSGFLSHKKV